MRKIIIVLAAWLTIGCVGKGTEVVSPPNPNDSKPEIAQIDTPYFEVDFDIPLGWTSRIIDGPDDRLEGTYFSDDDPQTVAVAEFHRGACTFTFFSSLLRTGTTLEQFVRIRRPTEELIPENLPEENARTIVTLQNQPGPSGGLVVDMYYNHLNFIFWGRFELSGTSEEVSVTAQEFERLLDSIEVDPLEEE